MFAPVNLNLRFYSIFQAFRLALSPAKLAIILMGLSVSYLAACLITYFAFHLEGFDLQLIWQRYRLNPLQWPTEFRQFGIAGLACLGLAGSILTVAYCYFGTWVSRITFRRLKGHPFYSLAQGRKYTLRHAWQIILPPSMALAVLGAIVASGALIALISKIPYIGNFLLIIMLPVLLILGALTLICVAVIPVLMLFLPSLVAVWDEDSLGTLIQAFTLTLRRPILLVFLTTITVGMAYIGMLVSGWLLVAVYTAVSQLLSEPWILGENWGRMAYHAEQIAVASFGNLLPYLRELPLAYPSADMVAELAGGKAFLGSGPLTLVLLLILALPTVYGISILLSGLVITFIYDKSREANLNLLTLLDEEDRIELSMESGDN